MSQSPPYADRKVLYYNSYLGSGGGERGGQLKMIVYKHFRNNPESSQGAVDLARWVLTRTN